MLIARMVLDSKIASAQEVTDCRLQEANLPGGAKDTAGQSSRLRDLWLVQDQWHRRRSSSLHRSTQRTVEECQRAGLRSTSSGTKYFSP